MESRTYVVGERVDKLCAVCGDERGHVVASVTKRGQISRVSCPVCSTRSTYKSKTEMTGARLAKQAGAPYDPTRQYRAGQMMTHPAFGQGEVTALVEPQKIDVLFADRLRRLIHGRMH